MDVLSQDKGKVKNGCRCFNTTEGIVWVQADSESIMKPHVCSMGQKNSVRQKENKLVAVNTDEGVQRQC